MEKKKLTLILELTLRKHLKKQFLFKKKLALQYHHKKQEEVEFYDRFAQLEIFWFKWEGTALEFEYCVNFSTNKKN